MKYCDCDLEGNNPFFARLLFSKDYMTLTSKLDIQNSHMTHQLIVIYPYNKFEWKHSNILEDNCMIYSIISPLMSAACDHGFEVRYPKFSARHVLPAC